MDLEILKNYSSGNLPHRQYLAVHREAAELLEILQEHLHPGEYVVTLTDWPAPRPRRAGRQYVALKSMMLLTPFVLVCGFLLASSNPEWALISGLSWFAVFTGVAIMQLILRRSSASKSREGRSVVAVSQQRIMRIWLDGSGEFQSWPLGKDTSALPPMEPVSDTIKLLLHLDLGNVSLN